MVGEAAIWPEDARSVTQSCDIWITDPPYADAINYHELSEFFLAWYATRLQEIFPEWYTDSKRALAVRGVDEAFRHNMVDCYRNLASHMPADGAQIVMFTHQDASVWADLALILWASGLRVTAAWCIATETDTAMREGNYVQGTVLLICESKRPDETAFLDEIVPQVEEEVKAQLDSMLKLDDQEDPNFGDTDYQLAAYAAALRVLTKYRNIEDIDVSYELSKTRKKDEESPIEHVIADAVKTACDHLVPKGFDQFAWKTLTPEERFYLKGLDLESHGSFAPAHTWNWRAASASAITNPCCPAARRTRPGSRQHRSLKQRCLAIPSLAVRSHERPVRHARSTSPERGASRQELAENRIAGLLEPPQVPDHYSALPGLHGTEDVQLEG